MNISLIGFMCSGKSRVGKELAARMGWRFLDTDESIAKAVGMKPGEIIRTQGEPVFREHEIKSVQEAATQNNVVIATGGGVPLHPGNITALKKSGPVIWLKVSPEIVVKRAGDFSTRPLIDANDPLNSVTQRLAERSKAYQSADYSIDTDQMTVDQIVEKIQSMISGLS